MVLISIRNGALSHTDNLELYHYGLHWDLDARTKAGCLWWDPWIVFNDAAWPPPAWNKMSSPSFDQLLFHELTHLYGTEDADSIGDFLNAHTISKIFR